VDSNRSFGVGSESTFGRCGGRANERIHFLLKFTAFYHHSATRIFEFSQQNNKFRVFATSFFSNRAPDPRPELLRLGS
jgi:hypothetical protein